MGLFYIDVNSLGTLAISKSDQQSCEPESLSRYFERRSSLKLVLEYKKKHISYISMRTADLKQGLILMGSGSLTHSLSICANRARMQANLVKAVVR